MEQTNMGGGTITNSMANFKTYAYIPYIAHITERMGCITSWAQQRFLLQHDGINPKSRHCVIQDFTKERE